MKRNIRTSKAHIRIGFTLSVVPPEVMNEFTIQKGSDPETAFDIEKNKEKSFQGVTSWQRDFLVLGNSKEFLNIYR